MKITYFGHSACLVETAEHQILIDPFLSDNPLCEVKPEELSCDYILLTHGHFDHVGDTIELARKNDAMVVCSFELSMYFEKEGLAKVHPINIGGRLELPFGSVQMTIAFHSSSIPDSKNLPLYMGQPGGLLIKADGKTVYHAGDTALTMEFELLAKRHNIDLAMLPIGDCFTMGIEDALAALEMLKPKQVIPIHYNTFPPIEVDPAIFAEGARKLGVEAHILESGDQVEL